MIAGVRSEKDREVLLTDARGKAGRVEPVILDVTSEASITEVVRKSSELSCESGLRAVINNAGIVVAGPMEHVSAADWRRQFDVNVFGMIELTRATLPLLRRGVAFHGVHAPRLVFVSSIGGRVAQPGLSAYTSSKFATTALGDALRLEIRRQGIGVTVVEPGAIKTAIWAKGDSAAEEFSADHPARRFYDAEITGLTVAAKRAASKAISPDIAAAAIVGSVMAKRAPAHVLVGPDAKLLAVLKRWLPASWFDGLLMREFGISGQPVLGLDSLGQRTSELSSL